MQNLTTSAATAPATASVVTPAKPAKPARKPAATKAVTVATAKPAKPAKPPVADRSPIIAAHRATVAAIYNGPSLSVRSSVRSPALTVYAELLASPKHRTTIAKLTTRDESALRLIASNLKAGAFNPVSLNLDRGNFSRLASVGFIVASGDTFGLSKRGAETARLCAKRAA
jgi:hypothetical protein